MSFLILGSLLSHKLKFSGNTAQNEFTKASNYPLGQAPTKPSQEPAPAGD
jgi:hypothetical protein